MPKSLGVIKFVYDGTKTRSLNATQVYDTQSSGITLGSFAGTVKGTPSSKSSVIENKNKQQCGDSGGCCGCCNPSCDYCCITPGVVNVQETILGNSSNTNVAKENTYKHGESALQTKVMFLSLSSSASVSQTKVIVPTLLNFQGITQQAGDNGVANSTASNKTFYYGGIPVATGLYKGWQGKYAVLTINKVTKKATLRIFDE